MIADFIKEIKEKGLRQEDIATQTGLTQAYISKLERGSMPSLETVIKLADIFKTTTDHVLGRGEKCKNRQQEQQRQHLERGL